MTLITTHISKYGIIHAADSNVTEVTEGEEDAAIVRSGVKVFDLRPHLEAALGVAGSYSVGGTDMEVWMPSFVDLKAADDKLTLGLFAEALSEAFQRQMTDDEKENGSIVHLAGYATDGNESIHPEFWLVRNLHSVSSDGQYRDLGDFAYGEDFWKRDCPTDDSLVRGSSQIYANGLHEGRIPFMLIQKQLPTLFQQIWSQPNWQLRPPDSLAGYEKLVRLYMTVVTTLYDISNLDSTPIGGDIQVVSIQAPLNTLTQRPPSYAN